MSPTFLAFLACGFVLVSGAENQSAALGISRDRPVPRNETDKEAKKYGKLITKAKSVTKVLDSLTILHKIVNSGYSDVVPNVDWKETSTFFRDFESNKEKGDVKDESDENVTYYGENLVSVSVNTIDPGLEDVKKIFSSAHSVEKTSPLAGVDVNEQVTNGGNYIENTSFFSADENQLNSPVQLIGSLEINQTSLMADRGNLTIAANFTNEIFLKIEAQLSTRKPFTIIEKNLINSFQETTYADESFYNYQSTKNNSTASSYTSSTIAPLPSNSIDIHIDTDLRVTSDSYSRLQTNTPSVEPFSHLPSANYSTTKQKWPVQEWASHRFFTEEYLSKIPDYWLSFSPSPPTNHYVLAVIYCLIMLGGVAGNLLVIIMFCRCKSLKSPANILVMNLAFSDLFLLAKMPIFIYNSIYMGPVLGEVGCKIYGFVGGLTGTVSIATLAAIGVDRYFVIVYPLEATSRSTRLRSRLLVVFVWLYGLTFSTIPLLDFDFASYVPEGLLTSCSFNYLDPKPEARAFIFLFFVAAWVVPCCVLIFSYRGIWRVVAEAREVRPGDDLMRHCRENDKRSTELRLAKVVVGVVCLWFVAWTPYAIVALLGITGNKELLTPIGSMIPALLCKFASAIDPYYYAFTHKRFRQELFNSWNRIRGKPEFRASQARSRVVTLREFVAQNSNDSNSDPGIELDELQPQEPEPEADGAPVDLQTIEAAAQDGDILAPTTWPRHTKLKMTQASSLQEKYTVKVVDENVCCSVRGRNNSV